MRNLIPVLLLLCFFNVKSQEADKKAVQNTIVAFFDGFHKQDSVLIKQTVSDGIIAQTIGRNKEGKGRMRTENFSTFLQSIVSIPDSISFKEKLLSFNIQIDGAMANAWTPYEFWLNDEFHHCGVNSFQLFKEEDTWKIIYLIDTRRRQGCQD